MDINGHYRLAAWFYRVGSWIFPTLSELQIGFAYSVGAGLLILHPQVAQGVWKFIVEMGTTDIRGPLFLLLISSILFFPLYAVLRRDKLSEYAKLSASFLYFGFFAFLALGAWDSVQLVTAEPWSLAWFNLWLIRVLLVWAIARFIITGLFIRIDDFQLNKLITQNFRDTQYRLVAFGLAATIGITSVLVLNYFYHDTVTVASLSFIYGGTAVSLLTKLHAMTLS